MNYSGGMSRADLEEKLRESGYVETDHRTEETVMWRRVETGALIQVPIPRDGYYPDSLLAEIEY